MKTVCVKLSDEQAEALTIAAARRGMTISAAVWALLRLATADFTDFSALKEAPARKRGRAGKPKATDELAACFDRGETLPELFDRFDRPRRKPRS